jgi:hypothetical protein
MTLKFDQWANNNTGGPSMIIGAHAVPFPLLPAASLTPTILTSARLSRHDLVPQKSKIAKDVSVLVDRSHSWYGYTIGGGNLRLLYP